MDAYEATRIILSRIQALDPENAAKTMGLLLIQDHNDKEMIRLAFGPETLLHFLMTMTATPMTRRGHWRNLRQSVLLAEEIVEQIEPVHVSDVSLEFHVIVLPSLRRSLRRHLPFSGHDPAAASQLRARARASLSPLRRDSHQIPIGSYNPVNDSLLGTLPVSSRFDAGSEFYDDVSVSRAVSSMPGSSREMMAMKAGGDLKAMNTAAAAN